MNVFKKLFVLLPLFFPFHSISQNVFEKYGLDSIPKITPAEKLDQSAGELILSEKIGIEYYYALNGDFLEEVTHYMKIKVFTDKGIERRNKVYISAANVIKFTEIKARSISPGGKVVDIPSSAIKDENGSDGEGQLKMFAIEGLEKNSEIEYTYTIRRVGKHFGTELVQGKVPKLKFEIEIVSPRNIIFEGKLYNTKDTLTKDTLKDGKNRIYYHSAGIKGLEEEQYSYYRANLIRIEFKLAYNHASSKARLLTWDIAADRYYRSLCVFNNTDKADVRRFIRNNKLSGPNSKATIRAIESFIKLKIGVATGESEDYGNLGKIIDNKIGNTTGILELFLATFSELNIKTELVLTCSRVNQAFDPTFDTWNFFDDFVIYFPEHKTYLAPNESLSRLGFIPPGFTGQKALFVHEVDLGANEEKSAVAKLKTIPLTDYQLSNNLLEAVVDFSADMMSTLIQMKQTYIGYDAYYNQPLIQFLNDNQKKELGEQLIKIVGDDAVVSDVNFSGIKEEDVLVNPMVVSGKLKSPSMIERAGSKYLFKVGVLIGPQSELYSQEKRETPGQISFPHSYTRKLTIHIPANIAPPDCKGLDIKQIFNYQDKINAQFISSYTLVGNQLDLFITEEYRDIDCPLEKFDEYRKIINAAADFNKIVLVFESKP